MFHDVLVVLPARWGSTRFPGKALADIHGKPMVVRAYENAKRQAPGAIILVATDSKIIMDVCYAHNVRCFLTYEKHATGTDRTAEVARACPMPYVVNMQPDEPLLTDGVVAEIVRAVKATGRVCCGMAEIKSKGDVERDAVGKVVCGEGGTALYISRSVIPGRNAFAYYTQVCVYGFTYGLLQWFAGKGEGRLEKQEGIELLRVIENGQPLQMVHVPGGRLAVDEPGDIEKVRAAFLEGG